MNVEQPDRLNRYQRVRRVGLRLNMEMVRRLSRAAIQEGAKRLGMLKGGTILFDSEDQSSVLMDFCIHHCRDGSQTALERHVATSRHPPDSDEAAYLRAQVESRYSLFAVEDVSPGSGAHLSDILRNERIFLMDFGFSQCAEPGMRLASRVLQMGDFWMTTGAGLPVDDSAWRETRRLLDRMRAAGYDPRHPTREQEADLEAGVVRACLRAGAGGQISYQTHGERPPSEDDFGPARSTDVRVGLNAPCPCGSGRKFKRCCGRGEEAGAGSFMSGAG